MTDTHNGQVLVVSVLLILLSAVGSGDPGLSSDVERAEELQEKGLHQEAISHLQGTLERCYEAADPGNFDRAATRLVGSLLYAGDLKSAQETAVSAAGRYPHIPEIAAHVLRILASYAADMGDFRQVEEIYERINVPGSGFELARLLRHSEKMPYQYHDPPNLEHLAERSVFLTYSAAKGIPDYVIRYYLEHLARHLLERGALDEAAWQARMLFVMTLGSVRSLALLDDLFKQWPDPDIKSMEGFCKFQLEGKAGPDARLGTPDDLESPLAAACPPKSPERIKTIRDALAGLPLNAFKARGNVHLLAGESRKALRLYYRHYLTCEVSEVTLANAYAHLAMALTAINDRLADVDEIEGWLTYGPRGPDERADTEDDIKDPFDGLLD